MAINLDHGPRLAPKPPHPTYPHHDPHTHTRPGPARARDQDQASASPARPAPRTSQQQQGPGPRICPATKTGGKLGVFARVFSSGD